MNSPSPDLILVCDSHRPRIHGGGCCSDKGGARLAERLREKLVERGFDRLIEVRDTGCLRNCREGISLKIVSDNTLYAKVKEADLDEIIDKHLLKKRPVKRLLVSDKPRFMSF